MPQARITARQKTAKIDAMIRHRRRALYQRVLVELVALRIELWDPHRIGTIPHAPR